MNKITTPLTLLILAAPILFFMGCASTNPAVVLWQHGFSKETDNNPISLSDNLVWHENQVTGIATNHRGKKFWFTADLETKMVEIYALTDKNGTDLTDQIISQLKEKVALGGEIVRSGAGEAYGHVGLDLGASNYGRQCHGFQAGGQHRQPIGVRPREPEKRYEPDLERCDPPYGRLIEDFPSSPPIRGALLENYQSDCKKAARPDPRMAVAPRAAPPKIRKGSSWEPRDCRLKAIVIWARTI